MRGAGNMKEVPTLVRSRSDGERHRRDGEAGSKWTPRNVMRQQDAEDAANRGETPLRAEPKLARGGGLRALADADLPVR